MGNEEVIAAQKNIKMKNAFLQEEQDHILRLASRITHKSLTYSDEEWSVALWAVASAIDSYEDRKGDFWPYAALVMSSRLTDMYRSEARRKSEISVRPEAFDGDVDDEDPDYLTQCEVQQHAGVTVDTSLKEEIEALQHELKSFGISFFDLAECSPKAEKTRKSCAILIKAFFAPPPPLVDKLRNTKILPVKELLSRSHITRKIIDRYRKYLITSALILDGDYPGLADYLDYIKKALRAEGGLL